MSNRDIAQALFVTVRTVETHLSHLYKKLDLHSRDALGAALHQQGDTGAKEAALPAGSARGRGTL